jgi:hypothetical protein
MVVFVVAEVEDGVEVIVTIMLMGKGDPRADQQGGQGE